jgi:hypothetical protein
VATRNWIVRASLVAVAALAGLALLRWVSAPAQAEPKHPEGPVGTYQISSYVIEPTSTRANWVVGYYMVDTRTGEVTQEERNVW